MSISDEDRALFRNSLNGVKPLANITPRATIPITNIASLKSTNRKPDTIKIKSDDYLSNYYTEIVQPHSTLTHCKHDIPRKRLTELKNGRIPWEARLDLHGLRPDDARRALCDFIERKSHEGLRCLLIIHGKGSRYGEEPVLKNHVNHWLKQLPQILAFHSARDRDGGSGALYVLLKRIRP